MSESSDAAPKLALPMRDGRAWRGARALDQELFVFAFALAGDELTGWTSEQIRCLSVPGWPPAVHSVWSRGEDGRLVVDIFECASRLAAHDLAIEALEQFKYALIERAKVPLGDVAFAASNQGAIVFARANLLVILRHAAHQPDSVFGAAFELDNLVSSKPSARGVALDLGHLDARFETADVAALELPPDRGPGEWVKLFSRTGEIFAEDHRLLYRHHTGEAPEVTAIVVTAGRPRRD